MEMIYFIYIYIYFVKKKRKGKKKYIYINCIAGNMIQMNERIINRVKDSLCGLMGLGEWKR
jgi:hypothetical protein